MRKATISFVTSACLSVYLHETTQLSLEGKSWNKNFSNICRENSSCIKIWHKKQVLYMKTNILCISITSYSVLLRMRNVSDKSLEKIKTHILSYVYWTVHHLDSWKETKLMSPALLFHYLMLNMLRMLIHPPSGACDLFVELFHGLYCSGSMRVGVTLWFGWCGVVSGCRLQPVVATSFTQQYKKLPHWKLTHVKHYKYKQWASLTVDKFT